MNDRTNPLWWVVLVLLIALLVCLILSQPGGAQEPEPDPLITYTFVPMVKK